METNYTNLTEKKKKKKKKKNPLPKKSQAGNGCDDKVYPAYPCRSQEFVMLKLIVKVNLVRVESFNYIYKFFIQGLRKWYLKQQ